MKQKSTSRAPRNRNLGHSRTLLLATLWFFVRLVRSSRDEDDLGCAPTRYLFREFCTPVGYDTPHNLKNMQTLIQLFSPSTPELAAFSGSQSAKAIAMYLPSVPCLNINIGKYSYSGERQLNFMNLPLQKIHIYKTKNHQGFGFFSTNIHKFETIMSNILDLNVHTFKLSNLSTICPSQKMHTITRTKDLLNVRVKSLVFDNVSRYVIHMGLAKLALASQINLTITNCKLTTLQFMDKLYSPDSGSVPDIRSLFLTNLPCLTDFYLDCLQRLGPLECLVLRNLGRAMLLPEENRMGPMLEFLMTKSIARLTLPIDIFELVWSIPDYGVFSNMNVNSLFIEDIDEPRIKSFVAANDRGNFNYTYMPNLSLRFKPNAILTAAGFESLLRWVCICFGYIKTISIHMSNWKDLLPQVASREWELSIHLLEALKIGEEEAILTETCLWREDALVGDLPELTRKPKWDAIHIIPLDKYSSWATGTIFSNLTQEAASILPVNMRDDNPTFKCPVCLCPEEGQAVENMAPSVCLLACGHSLCIECLNRQFIDDAQPYTRDILWVTDCPSCNQTIHPSTITLLTQKHQGEMYCVLAPICAHLLDIYQFTRHISMHFECVATPDVDVAAEPIVLYVESVEDVQPVGIDPEINPGLFHRVWRWIYNSVHRAIQYVIDLLP
ncbi:hypothetical protein NEDG_02142 [Nematocida displodere]|uniref:RING-type domain-containing protein n=1 Tax=Nematocida displodere TaxID=1805483 RepID=A0A177EJY2_9MICR|nr:hypothetical protein NEDG_01452 [Nematocida displodere]OAG32275.1 hypothetical protein NEDG_02142 [Nematocida displodere]